MFFFELFNPNCNYFFMMLLLSIFLKTQSAITWTVHKLSQDQTRASANRFNRFFFCLNAYCGVFYKPDGLNDNACDCLVIFHGFFDGML